MLRLPAAAAARCDDASTLPVGWQAHGFKVRAMKAAWSGLVLHSSAELLRGGMSAFKANWREQQLQRSLLAGCVGCWQALARKYRAAAVMRQRIEEVRGIIVDHVGPAAMPMVAHMV